MIIRSLWVNQLVWRRNLKIPTVRIAPPQIAEVLLRNANGPWPRPDIIAFV